MKSFSCPKILVTIGAILSVVAAVDTSIKTTTEFGAQIISSSSVATTTTTSARRLDDDEPWDNGTKVYTEFPNEGWWAGTITSYNPTSEMYTVTWEDGSTDYYDDDDTIDQMVAYAQNDPLNNVAGFAANAVAGKYSVGTKVSVFEEGEWCDGLIVQYGSDVDTYTIKWDDNEVEQIQAGAVMDNMVVDADGDDDAPPAGYEGGPSSVTGSVPTVGENGFPVGTPVSYYDEDGVWQDGTITSYSDSTYYVMWQDGSTDDYDDFGDDLQELKQNVEDAYGDDDSPPMGNANAPKSGPSFANGTPVSDFEEGEWVDGEVVSFQDGNYIVEWNDEDDVEYYASSNAEDMQELTKMTQYALGDDDGAPSNDDGYVGQDLWKTGTRVAFFEDDVWYLGSITGFTNGNYKISWDVGETELEDDFDFVNQMVADGVTQSPLKTRGMTAVGKAFLSIFIIALCVVGSFFGYKFYEKRQIQLAREERLASDGDDAPTYRDEPSELPKII
jgi:hypothetical protein